MRKELFRLSGIYSLLTYILSKKAVLVFFMVFASAVIYARVGGAGGDTSDFASDDDGIVSLIMYILFLIPFPYNIIAIAVVILIAWFAKKKAKQQSVLNKLPTGQPVSKIRGYDDFIQNNPEFNENVFKEKVKISFLEIQDAWQKKNMGKVRKYISDGMYQRLNIQFKMMDKLSQMNKIDKLEVKNIYIDRIDTDGFFDVIHTAIHASVIDRFISDKYPELNSGGSEEFVEYWSYIKKRGAAEKNLFTSGNCPSCGALLPDDGGEIAKCNSCGTLTNSGEYDWVLSEITQADDYISANPFVMKAANLQEKIIETVSSNSDFSVQLIEDKASNAFLQIETARVFNDPAIMRRFVSESAFGKISTSFDKERQFVYNRIYLSDVTLIGAFIKDNLNNMVVSIKYSYQRVIPKDKKVEKLDPVIVTNTSVIILSRNAQPSASKGSLYAHRCPSCGGPVKDTTDLKCQFCGNMLNSTANEWIVSDLMSLNDYYSFYAMNAAGFAAGIKPDLIDNSLDVRDYVLNNSLIVMACDGNFSNEEKEYAVSLAKKFGYNAGKLEPMFNMAMNGQLAIKMPDEPKKKEKVYKLMEKAASVDGNIDPAEQALLESLKSAYGINVN